MDMLQGNLSPAEPDSEVMDGNNDDKEQVQKSLEETPCPSGPPIDHYQPSGRRLNKKELLDRLSYANQKAWSSVRKRSMVPLPLPAATERRMRQWFELVDGDGSGHLNASEVEFALKASGINASATTVAEVIKLLSSAKSPLGEDCVLPSGTALPIGSMIDALRRRKILQDVQKGGTQREFWAAEGQEFLRYLLETEDYNFDDESRETIRRILEYKSPVVKEGEFAISPKAAEEHKRRIERLKQALLRNGGGGSAAPRRANSTTKSRIYSAMGGSSTAAPAAPAAPAAATIGPSGCRRSFDIAAPQGGGGGGAGSSRASRILRAVDQQRRETVDGALRSSATTATGTVEAAAAADVTEEGSESGGSSIWTALMEEKLAARVRFCRPILAQEDMGGLQRSDEGPSASASASASPQHRRNCSSSGCSSPRPNPNSAPPSTTTSRTVHPDGGIGGGIFRHRISGGGTGVLPTAPAGGGGGGGGGVWSAAASATATGSRGRDGGARDGGGANGTYDSGGWAARATRRPVLGPRHGLSPFPLRDAGGDQDGSSAAGGVYAMDRTQPAEESSNRGVLRDIASGRNVTADGVEHERDGSAGFAGNGKEHDHTGCHDHDDDHDDDNGEEEEEEMVEEEESCMLFGHGGASLFAYNAVAPPPSPSPQPPPPPVTEATLSCITATSPTASPMSVSTLAAPPGLLQRRPVPTGPFTNQMLRSVRGSRQGALSPTRAAAAAANYGSGGGVSLDGSILTTSAAFTAAAAAAAGAGAAGAGAGAGATGFRPEGRSTGTGSEVSSLPARKVPAVIASRSGANSPSLPAGNVSADGGAVGVVGGSVDAATGLGAVANAAVVSGSVPWSAAARDPASPHASALEASSKRRAEAVRMMGNGRADMVAAEIRRNAKEAAQHLQQQQQQQTRGSWSSGLGSRTTSSYGGQAAQPYTAPGLAPDPALLSNVVDLVGFEQWLSPSPPPLQHQHAGASGTISTTVAVAGVGMLSSGPSYMSPRCGSGSGSGSCSGAAAGAAAARAFPGSQKYDMGLKPTQASSYAPLFSAGSAMRSLSPVSALSKSRVGASTAPTRTGGAAAGLHHMMTPSPPPSPTVILQPAAERSTAGVSGGFAVGGSFSRDGRTFTGRRSLDSEPRVPTWRNASAGRAHSPSPGAGGGSQSHGHISGNPSRLQPWGRGPWGGLHHSHHQLQQQQQLQYQQLGGTSSWVTPPGSPMHSQLQPSLQQQQQQQMDPTATVGDLRAASFPSAAGSPRASFHTDRPFMGGNIAATAGAAGDTAGTPPATGGAFVSSATAAANAAASANAGVMAPGKHAAAGDGKKWPWPWKREMVTTDGMVGTMAAKRGGIGGAGVGGDSGQNLASGGGDGGGGGASPATRVRSSFLKWS